MRAFDLTGRVAVVTGGNGGIGLGMARGLAEAGATVVVAGRDAGQGRRGGARPTLGAGGRASCRSTSPTRSSCRAMVAETREAARPRSTSWSTMPASTSASSREDYTLAEWHQVIDINLTSAFLCAQAAYPRDEGGRRRQDHQHRLDDVDLRRLLRRRLRRRARAASCR